MKKLAAVVLSVVAATSQAGQIYEGEAAAKLLVGNTVEATYRAADDEGRHVFYEYYTESGEIYGGDKRVEQIGTYTHYVGSWEVVDSKLCTSVYGRTRSCNTYEKIDENTFKQSSDTMVFRNVVIHQGKYHPSK